MNTKRTMKWIGLPLLFAAVVAAYFLGRMTSTSPAPADDVPMQMTGDREILYWRAPMDPTEIYDEPGKSKMGMDLVPVYADEQDSAQAGTGGDDREILYWQAPMNPTEIYDSPGKSAMGMDLVPVYADEAGKESGGTVSIDPATVQNMGVRSAPVERIDFTRSIRTVGEVEYDEEALYLVNTKISGWIEKLHVDYLGASVEKGDPLLEIYSPELVATQQDYLLALKNARNVAGANFVSVQEDADQVLRSTRKRLEYWDIPASEIERLEETGEVKKTVLLKAPASGIVVKKNAVEGDHIKAGDDLYQIADLSKVWVHASVYDNELPWIREGQSATMELSYLPGQKYEGRVSYIYPYLREKARDVHVRLIFDNPDLSLKPGMYVNVQLQGKTIPDALVIPSEAAIRSGERTVAFVVQGPGRFEPREIQIGVEGGPGGRYVRVLSGLLEGEEVVTSAQFMLDSESRLQEAIQKMLEERGRDTSRSVQHGQGSDSAGHSMAPGDSMPDGHSMAPGDSMSDHQSMPEMEHQPGE
jgi:Cu(I)/Ag(I) efflux system membrane fusion protein/cobalt-zinc-cadmium efflux system membrane fusion protein